MTGYPILYSFRRCPYAMRARMALYVSSQTCELREVVLRDKPVEMIELSPKATVPVMQLESGEVLEQSLDIMLWTLKNNDPAGWFEPEIGTLDEMLVLIEEADGDFKENLDRYKYANRYENVDPIQQRTAAEKFLTLLEERLANSAYLFGNKPALADYAIAPFIRQFANTDRNWFDAAPYPHLQKWLEAFLTTEPFTQVMSKYPAWQFGNAPLWFGATLSQGR
jgi:glutathione S-transferase